MKDLCMFCGQETCTCPKTVCKACKDKQERISVLWQKIIALEEKLYGKPKF